MKTKHYFGEKTLFGIENVDFSLVFMCFLDFETKSINFTCGFTGFPKEMLLWLGNGGATPHRFAATATFFRKCCKTNCLSNIFRRRRGDEAWVTFTSPFIPREPLQLSKPVWGIKKLI